MPLPLNTQFSLKHALGTGTSENGLWPKTRKSIIALGVYPSQINFIGADTNLVKMEIGKTLFISDDVQNAARQWSPPTVFSVSVLF